MKEVTEAPTPITPAAKQGISAKIEAAANFAKLQELQQEYKQREEQSEDVDQAFASKWKTLTKGMKPQALAEGLDFVALDTKASGEKEYTFSFLFRSTANLDTDYQFGIIAKVDPSHVRNIKPIEPGGSSTQFALDRKANPTSQWKAGEYRVVQLKVETEPIPYNLRLYLFIRDAQYKWTGNPRNMIDLGWQTDISE